MATVKTASAVPVHEISVNDGRKLLDKQAQRYLKMSGDEFVRAWEAGAFDADADRPEIMRLVMLIPFGK